MVAIGVAVAASVLAEAALTADSNAQELEVIPLIKGTDIMLLGRVEA